MAIAYISLGANLGDPAVQLRAAAQKVAVVRGTRVTSMSSLYRTSPVDNPDQPEFFNAVLEVETSLPADELMAALLDIEQILGRERGTVQANQPRRIDCDLLMYGDLETATESLQLPHPRMKDRLFVLLPLQEIAPEIILPGQDSLEFLCDRARKAGQSAVIAGRL